MAQDEPSRPGNTLIVSPSAVAQRMALPVSERRTRLPTVPPVSRVSELAATIDAVDNGAGLWARRGGRIGNSEVRALRVLRAPTDDEVLHGAEPGVCVEKKGYEALALLFEHSPLDVQMEIYRRLSRRRPWWAWLDVFGWLRGARSPVERFEEEYEPGGAVEVFVMGHDQGAWFLPNLFRRWFHFTVGRGDWTLGLEEVTQRGGDVEADDLTKRGYAPSLLKQFEDMTPAQSWRALCAIEGDLLDSPVGSELERIDPTWFDPLRFGVAFLYDANDPARGRSLRETVSRVRGFLFSVLVINPYAVERGFDLSFVPVSRKFPEIPSEPVHQFVVDLRTRLPATPEHRMDLLVFGAFIQQMYPRWPQLTPGQLHRVRSEGDDQRFFGRRVDLWGEAVKIRTRKYTVAKVLRHSTREYVGRDREGRARYRTKTTRWTARVPALLVTFDIRGAEGLTTAARYDRVGDAHATGHYSHYTVDPPLLDFLGGVERFHGELDIRLGLEL